MTPIIDKRKFERFKLEMVAAVFPLDEKTKWNISDYTTINVCAGGAYFKSTARIPIGTDVAISLYLPKLRIKPTSSNSIIELTGSIVRSNNHGMAIKFNSVYKVSQINKLSRNAS